MTKVNPEMIVLARESRGLSQRELADRLGISPALLCQLEQSNRSLSDDMVEKLEKELKYPQGFFGQEGEAYLTSTINFRKRLKVPRNLISSIEANIQVYRLNIELLLEKIKVQKQEIPHFDLEKLGSVQEAAKKLRKLWNVHAGAIDNVTALLESKGIITIAFDFGTERVDSRVVLTRSGFPVIIYNKSLLGDRQRFTLAFELGHLVLHSSLVDFGDRDIDHEANLFAAEFLMPANDIRSDFKDGLTIQKLADLKKKWKVSMQALLFRAHDLEDITYNQRTYLLQQFNEMKIRRREPPELDIKIEKPKLLRDMFTKYRNALKVTVNELAELFYMTEEEFMTRYTM
ncbi:MAG: ImmA/IrrE family metallo-endopeptidase [Bacteroidia bacterium]|nr:ImmA/IrrE family metallo-endopeptidase [Bacteroidia bacterium]